MASPVSTPKAALIWDCAGMKMEYRIMQRKLEFLNYIVHLPPDSLAYQILETQEQKKYPGLLKECEEFVSQLKIPNPMKIKIPKREWKKIVKKAVLKTNEEELKEDIMNYKKLRSSPMASEEFFRRPYISSLTLKKCRTMFKFRSSMTEHVKMNQKSNPAYSKDLWKCEECGNQDLNSHLLWCPGYAELRGKEDLVDDDSLCSYLQKIFMMRNEKEVIKMTT